VLFQGSIDLTKLRRGRHRPARHRPEIPEADRFESQTVEDNILLALKAKRDVLANLFWSASSAAGPRSTRCWRPSASTMSATASPARSRTARSNGLEIGMLLAQDPKPLLVDEPARRH